MTKPKKKEKSAEEKAPEENKAEEEDEEEIKEVEEPEIVIKEPESDRLLDVKFIHPACIGYCLGHTGRLLRNPARITPVLAGRVWVPLPTSSPQPLTEANPESPQQSTEALNSDSTDRSNSAESRKNSKSNANEKSTDSKSLASKDEPNSSNNNNTNTNTNTNGGSDLNKNPKAVEMDQENPLQNSSHTLEKNYSCEFCRDANDMCRNQKINGCAPLLQSAEANRYLDENVWPILEPALQKLLLAINYNLPKEMRKKRIKEVNPDLAKDFNPISWLAKFLKWKNPKAPQKYSQKEAALCIQTKYRQHLAKKKFRALKTEAERKKSEEKNAEDRRKAAIKIQSVFRGHSVRVQLAIGAMPIN